MTTTEPKGRAMILLIRAGRYEMSVGRCPGQRLPATRKNGEAGRTVWLPGLSVNVRWGDR